MMVLFHSLNCGNTVIHRVVFVELPNSSSPAGWRHSLWWACPAMQWHTCRFLGRRAPSKLIVQGFVLRYTEDLQEFGEPPRATSHDPDQKLPGSHYAPLPLGFGVHLGGKRTPNTGIWVPFDLKRGKNLYKCLCCHLLAVAGRAAMLSSSRELGDWVRGETLYTNTRVARMNGLCSAHWECEGLIWFPVAHSCSSMDETSSHAEVRVAL